MGGARRVVRGKWIQLYLNNNKKKKNNLIETGILISF